MIKNTIAQALAKALEAEDVKGVEVQVSIPTDQKHGDYTSNVAMVAARMIGKNPFEVAQGLKGTLSEMAIEGVKDIQVIKPGFLNFWIDPKFIIAQINQRESLRSPLNVRQGETLNRRKVMVEFTDPNPFKEFHIGHLYTNIVGESLSRLFESQGDDVKRVCYQGDVGLHVAKALYGITQITNYEVRMKELENGSLEEKAKFLGECYVVGAKAYEQAELAKHPAQLGEEDPQVKEAIHILNKQVYELSSRAERGDLNDKEIASSQASRNDIEELYLKGRQWSLDYFETIYQRLGTKFTRYYFESEAGPIGIALVKKYIGKIFEESDGAVIFRGEPYGLHTRVFINKLGLPTYEAKELGLAPTKYKDFPYDLSVIVTGNEINEYFKVLLKALSLIDAKIAQRTKHIGHGMVDVKDEGGNRVKMSSRKGNVITGEWMLDTAKEKIKKAYPEMDADALEKVTIGSVKYAFLKSSIGKNIEFSFDESISFEGNSGPYLQYTYVRTQSILRKSGCHPELVSGSQASEMPKLVRDDKSVLNEEELTLLRTLFQYEDVVAFAAEDLAPSHIATYLFDLAQKFNNFYQKHKIIQPLNPLLPGEGQGEVEKLQQFRTGLTAVVGETIKNGLNLLGIPVPEKM